MNWICPICDKNDIKTKVDLKCNHSFCDQCIQKWVRKENSCPLCRKVVNTLCIGGKERMVLTRRQPVSRYYMESVALPDVMVSVVDLEMEINEKYELQAEMAYCMHCGGTHNSEVLMLCDNSDCLQASHTFCDYPQRRRVPEGPWFCIDCKQNC